MSTITTDNHAKIIISVLVSAVMVLCVACTNRSDDTVISSSNTVASDAAQSEEDETETQADLETSSDNDISREIESVGESEPSMEDRSGLPMMTSENQQYYDKYIAPFYAQPPFLQSFSENNFSWFYASSVYSCLTQPQEDIDVPQDTVEKLIQEYFPITSEQMRSLDSWYQKYESNQSYLIPVIYKPGQQYCGVVTNNQLEEEILVLTCDWYEQDHSQDNSPYTIYYGTSVTTVKLNQDGHQFYVSNQVESK